MPSISLQHWLSNRAVRLDEIEEAHRSVGGSGRGRRFATEQINHAYAVLLSSQFQGCCRDLHSECVEHLVRRLVSPNFQESLRTEFLLHRKLSKGNPNPGNIGADFERLGLSFWEEVSKADARNEHRKTELERLNLWRNAIAHQDFEPAKLGKPLSLQLNQVRAWRRACNHLADSFDKVLRTHLSSVTGVIPW